MKNWEICIESPYFKEVVVDCENCPRRNSDSDFCKNKRAMDLVRWERYQQIKENTEDNAT